MMITVRIVVTRIGGMFTHTSSPQLDCNCIATLETQMQSERHLLQAMFGGKELFSGRRVEQEIF